MWPGVEDDAGPHGKVNLTAKFFDINRSQGRRPTPLDHLDELLLGHSAEADDSPNTTVCTEPEPQADLTPPAACATAVINDVSQSDSPRPEGSRVVEERFDRHHIQLTRMGREDASGDVEGVAPRAGLAGGAGATVSGGAWLRHAIFIAGVVKSLLVPTFPTTVVIVMPKPFLAIRQILFGRLSQNPILKLVSENAASDISFGRRDAE
jgi:hypothetical protein